MTKKPGCAVNYSILDLCPVPEGSTAAQSMQNSADLAQHAERLGYHRYWMAEHHNMPGIASAATSVLLGHIAGKTTTIRVGAGGVMLPNHAPLTIAEQFGTLATNVGMVGFGPHFRIPTPTRSTKDPAAEQSEHDDRRRPTAGRSAVRGR